MTGFIRRASASPAGPEYMRDLWRWSVDDLDSFWSLMWSYGSVLGEKPTWSSRRRTNAQCQLVSEGAPELCAESAAAARWNGRWCFGEKEGKTPAQPRGAVRPYHAAVRRWPTPVSCGATGSPAICPICRRRSSRCWRRHPVWSSRHPISGVEGVMDRFGRITESAVLRRRLYYYNGR